VTYPSEMRRILVINGPNLDMLGSRDPEIYGTATLGDLEDLCRSWGAALGADVRAFQSNHEGAIIDSLHDARGAFDAIVLNPGAYAHTSYAIRDAIEAVGVPTVEVHISNIKEREPWRGVSVTAPACTTSIYGRGIDGYRWAIRHVVFEQRFRPAVLAYGDGPDHVGDLRIPEGEGPHPIAVLVHGGFWKREWTRDLMDGLAVDLAERGIATWNVEYRKANEGGGWPQTAEDVTTAIDHVAHLGARIDRDRTAVIGHSAGGHLALAARAATRTEVVALAAVTDLDAAHEDRLGSGAVARFFGDHPPGEASPIANLPLGVPQVLVHGTLDDTVPADYSRRYVDAARSAGDEVEYLELEGVGHVDLIDESSPAWSDIACRLVDRLHP
jgi:3-dehydroquinate dehydratase type II